MSLKTEQFGIHLMIDGYSVPKEMLEDKGILTEVLYKLPEKLNMHIICEPKIVEVGPLNKKDPGGVSGFVLIAESHISFHTFPKRGFISIDIYTCQNELDTEKITSFLKDQLKITDLDYYLQKRGIRYPSDNIF